MFQIGFSQNEKIINGTVLCNNSPVQGVEVVNATSKKVTVTDSKGNFTIGGKAKDILVFISKTHELKQLELKQQTINKNNFSISLTLKAEELKEVVVTKVADFKWEKDTKWEEGKRNQIVLEKASKALNVQGVYTGTIENGMDFKKIGKLLLGLFNKEKKPLEEAIPEIAFKTFATSTYPPEFFSKDLKLKPEEVPLFLEFCDADPKSKTIVERSDALSLMEFLLTKKTEFKKL